MAAVLSTAKMTLLRRAFVDICRGYSIARYDNRQIYIRHLSHFEHLEYESLQADFEAYAKSRGAKTQEEKLEELIKEGLWSKAKDRELLEEEDFLKRLEEGKRVIALPSMMTHQENQISEQQKKLLQLRTEKAKLLKMTVEVYAQTRLNDHYVITNLFEDQTFQKPLFNEPDFDLLSDKEVEDLLDVYHNCIDDLLSETSLKLLVVQDFFMSYYVLCAEDPKSFFDKPVSCLTYYQVRLLNLARYFKSIMENTDLTKVDPSVKNNPDALERLYLAQKNLREAEAEGRTPGNMTQEDIKTMGMQGKFTKIDKEMTGLDAIRHLQGQR